MAGKVRHLLNRGGRYYARLVVPVALRPFLNNKSELRTPLGADRHVALQKLPAAVLSLQLQIGTARESAARAPNRRSRPFRPLSPDEIAVIEYQSQIEFDAEIRQHYHQYAELGADADEARRFRDGFAGKLSDSALDQLVGWRIERQRIAGNTNVEKGTPEWRVLAQALCLSSYEAMLRQDERDNGNFSGKPVHPRLADALANQAQIERPSTRFDDVIGAEVKRRSEGRHAKPLPDRTVRKYRVACSEFAKFRNSDDASTVTAIEGKRWIETMQSDGRLSNRTIGQKLQNVATVLTWGRQNDPENFHPNGNPITGVKRPDYVTPPSDLSAFTMEEAALVLRAARIEDKAFLRWIPWLCAYSGMRVSEAGALRKEDFFKHDGRWFWRVTTIGRRRLKTGGSERRIPVHPTLEKEGLIAFVENAPPGELFRGTNNKPISVQQRLSGWIRKLIPQASRLELMPNHGWRHLFEDLCRRDGMPEEARQYITGRSDGKSRSMYGKSDVMLPGLVNAMDNIRPIEL